MSALVAPRFLPWVRSGLAAHIGEPAAAGMAQHDTATISLSVQLHATGEGDLEHVESVPGAGIRLRGPGDVVGIDQALVIRHDPEPGTQDAEDTYLALVEFSAPDLPWRYTPAAPADDRLQPWIALVVVEEREGVRLEEGSGSHLPLLHVDNPKLELPNVRQCWAWAHVEADHELAQGAADALEEAPGAFRSRLLCPRRLRKNTAWLACVVPTFSAGRNAGGGMATADTGLVAWDDQSEIPVVLPVYHSWRFKTGPGGDFESLVRRLQARTLPATVGRRDLDISKPGRDLPATKGSVISYQGALVSPAGQPKPWPKAERRLMKDALRKLVNAGGPAAAAPPDYDALTDDPVVGPPAYAAAQAGRSTVPGEARTPFWFEELNTEPQHRSVAGVATNVIRRDQEALMAKAWEHAAQAQEASRLLSRARAAWEGARRLHGRVKDLRDEVFVQFAAPAMARLRHQSGQTVKGAVKSSALPAGLLSGAFRRLSHTVVARGTRRRAAVADAVTRVALDEPVTFVGAWADVWPPAGADVRGPHEGSAGTGRPGPVRLEATRARAAAPIRDYILSTPVRSDTGLIRYSGDSSIATGLGGATREALDPLGTITRMVNTRISGLPADRADDVPDRVFVRPVFKTPMYRRLVALSVEYLVPGIGGVPDDTLGLLETNRAFLEAFLAGMNHEMGREFLWREYPARLGDTWFQYFWEGGPDATPDIVPISKWDAGLGANALRGAPAPSLVLLIKSALLRRYPDMRVYAVEATWRDGGRREDLEGDVQVPLFVARLAPDVAVYGFDLVESTARGNAAPRTREEEKDAGYFFVLEQQPGAPRFGLDGRRPKRSREAPLSWANLRWGHLVEAEAALPAFVDLDYPTWLRDAGALPGNGPGDGDTDVWGENAAAMARITFQRPVRMLVHADSMLPKPQPAQGER
jgi:hypothetical protein